MRLIKFILKFIIVVLIILLVVGGVLFFLMTRNTYDERYNVGESTEVISKSILSAASGTEVEISQDEINGFLTHIIKESNNKEVGEIKNIYINLCEEENRANIYMRCIVKGIEFHITSQDEITFNAEDRRFCINVNEMKVGKLKVSPNMLGHFIKNDEKNIIEVNRSKIYISYDAIKNNLYNGEGLNVDSFKIINNKVYLKCSDIGSIISKGIKYGINIIGNLLN